MSQKIDDWYKLEVSSLKFTPGIGQNTVGQIPEKPKGGPLDEKIFFFKNHLWSFSKHSQVTAFIKLIPKRYITWGLNIPYVCARSVHGLRSVHRACTVRKGCTDPKLYMFLESAWQMQSFWSVLKKIGNNFWKKIFFHLRVPPLVFRVFVRQYFCRSPTWNKWVIFCKRQEK